MILDKGRKQFVANRSLDFALSFPIFLAILLATQFRLKCLPLSFINGALRLVFLKLVGVYGEPVSFAIQTF